MRSHLLAGKVRHRRARPFVYELEHDVYYFALDLGELDEAIGKLALVSRNRPNVLAFYDRDHLDPPATDVPEAIRTYLRAEGVDPDGWRLTLVTSPRVFGYEFNPASFFLCRDVAGKLALVIIEVHNTHGDRHLYALRPERPHDTFISSMEKGFYVSPFIESEGRYTVRIHDDPTTLRIAIDLAQDGELLLNTSLVLRRFRLTNRTVARMLVRYPFVTLKTIVAIHWHALRLWRRGARFHRRGEAAAGTGGNTAP
jgi:uncharacterized protein